MLTTNEGNYYPADGQVIIRLNFVDSEVALAEKGYTFRSLNKAVSEAVKLVK